MNLTCYNTTDTMAMITCPAAAYPLMYPLIILAIWVIAFLTTSNHGPKTAMTYASLATALVAAPLMVFGLVNPIVLLILVVLAGIGMF